MGGHGSSLNRAVSLRTYTKPFSSGREFLNTVGRTTMAGVTAGTSELVKKDSKGLLGDVAMARDHAGDIILGPEAPAEPTPSAGDITTPPDGPLPGTDPNGPPTGAAPNPTQASEMAALKRRRLMRMGLLSTITTGPSGVTDAPNLLMPAAGPGVTLLG